MLSLKKKAWILFTTYLSLKNKSANAEAVIDEEANLTGEVFNIEDHWLLLYGDIHIDIKEATLIDENLCCIQIHQIEEGDIVDIWLEESEVIRTYPALATALVLKRRALRNQVGRKN